MLDESWDMKAFHKPNPMNFGALQWIRRVRHERRPEGMARGELAPEPWASEMKAAGLVSPRTGEASIKQLAEAAGLGPSTVHRIVTGKNNTSTPGSDTITKLAAALGIEPETVYKRVGGIGALPTKPKSLQVAGMDILESADWAALEVLTKRLVAQRRRVIEAEARLVGAAK
ncbi:helix-turn-helix domain-containing protein [Nocardia sp. NPDC127526]|uniref:helix-turn-helix domain-containing protein n=1 Tax=Nocardia sp. NPDC127526 TaxID=3345393 RepID=UPI00363A5602